MERTFRSKNGDGDSIVVIEEKPENVFTIMDFLIRNPNISNILTTVTRLSSVLTLKYMYEYIISVETNGSFDRSLALNIYLGYTYDTYFVLKYNGKDPWEGTGCYFMELDSESLEAYWEEVK